MIRQKPSHWLNASTTYDRIGRPLSNAAFQLTVTDVVVTEAVSWYTPAGSYGGPEC